ncbi:DegT/DnrJ/EryC1/StrS family aminotransferase [Methylacidiphilales bacterium]|nr:DegT/DnrJ/EryC1/StrS family aminotransferase [Candidatus Methylacidiphilales bacterium]MDB4793538.1 DegT/DnrJ/EryC1/StrS family aminotransferase [Candidatus Methylacidiphilales bacterium]
MGGNIFVISICAGEETFTPGQPLRMIGGMNVNLLDIKAQNAALEPELQEAFMRVLRSGHFILGPEVERFERSLEAFTGAKHALGVSSGTDAILVALMALGIGPGDEVLCPSFTFFATAGCISRVGAKPVFVDSCPVCFNLDVRDAARRITPRTKAILPVHLFGQAAEMNGILDLARKHNLRVIEDTAQAMGATYRGKQAGTLGDFGTISFYPTKNLGALGDAGAVLTNNTALFERARILRMHGMEPKYYHQFVGGNFRLDGIQAAMLSVKLPHFNGYTEARRRNASLYTEQLAKLPGVRVAKGEDCGCASSASVEEAARIVLPIAYPHNGHIWNQYTLRVIGAGRRDALRAHLSSRGVGSEIYYPLPLHEQACFAELGYKATDIPWAHRLAGEVISLPIYPELPADHIEQVCAVIAEFLAL